MLISNQLLTEVVGHARAAWPNECCGMVASRDDEAVKVYPATNIAAGTSHYEIDGAEQLAILGEIEAAGWQLGAIYHSHPSTPPVPSQADIDLAFYPDALYVIVGFSATGETQGRAWRIVDGEATEAFAAPEPYRAAVKWR